jgi:DNA-binding winged helix-turn-helix (wHTH) protein/tetratricopeptide (TPR) repeat protein
MQHEIFQFGPCELRVATRELLVRGEPLALEPRPFDVLVHLLRQRHRAVSSTELLDRLWPPGVGSEAAVARAVMKIRQALGDDAVRTVRRAGYRLALAVAETAAVHDASPAAASLALLPFENLTGRADLDWIELGLPYLVARELSARPGLSVVSVPALLAALQACPPANAPAERATALRRLLGVAHVARAQLRAEGARYRLELSFPGDASAVGEEASGDDVVQLGHALAQRLAVRLLPAAGAEHVDGVDPLATALAFGRALQAVAEQRWTLALSLLEPVLACDPCHAGALRERLRALVALDDDRAFEFGSALLAGAAPALAAPVHLELANAYLRRRMTREARRHLDAAMRHEGAISHEDAFATLLLRASIAMNEFDFDASARLLTRADALCERHGSVFDRIRVASLKIVHEGESGRMAVAREHARRVADLYRDHGVMVGHARALSKLANASASLGLFDEALRDAEAAFALSRSMGVPTDMAVAGVTLCGLQRNLRQVAAAARTLKSFAGAADAAAPRSELFPLVGRAQLALARRQFAAAVPLLQRARDTVVASGQQLELHYVLPLLVGAMVQSGRLIDAEHACRDIEQLPRLDRDRNLQGALLHVRAQLAHASGDAAAALALLRRAAAVTPTGWWNAHARLDAAWLCLERARADEAAALLQGLDAWLAEHPVGRAVHARLLAAQGRLDEACGLHAMTMASTEPADESTLAALGQALARARRQGDAVTMPAVTSLATWM